MTTDQERNAATDALIAWLRNQEMEPKVIVPAFAQLAGAAIGLNAKSHDTLLEGIASLQALCMVAAFDAYTNKNRPRNS